MTPLNLPTGIPSKGSVDRAGAAWAARWENGRIAGPLGDSAVEELRSAERLISAWREAHAPPLARVAANLRYYTPPNDRTGQKEVSQRLKKFTTIVDKLQRQPKMALTRMVDIGGCRALFDSRAEVDTAVSRITENWGSRVVRVKDYVASPKVTGYRGVHLHVRHSGHMIEVQLRTPLQDLWAKFVENEERRLARHHWRIKDGRGPADLLDYYRVTADIFASIETQTVVQPEAIDRLRAATKSAKPYLSRLLVHLEDDS